ncbi:MAG: nitronate monooxygenase [Paracoccaceae bacterium]|jgi:nitronate monooxygenase
MIETRLTKFFGIKHPVLSAPMAYAAGGKLASAVTRAGGLGLIGGGYGNADWLKAAFQDAGNQKIGCGLITWRLAEQPELLELILNHAPAAMFLSFGDPEPFAPAIKAANVPLICQIQTLRDAKHAANSGADVIVAQGAEAGGHGGSRATLTIVPEVADWLAKNAPDVVLCAAGGIADGRGLAASLMLGADGVLVGSRFWASNEAQVADAMHDAALAATGDETVRSSVMDLARDLNWPDRYSARVLQNEFTERWHKDIEGLKAATKTVGLAWSAAWMKGDPKGSNTFIGEAAGLVHDIVPAAEIMTKMVAEAEALLGGSWKRI